MVSVIYSPEKIGKRQSTKQRRALARQVTGKGLENIMICKTQEHAKAGEAICYPAVILLADGILNVLPGCCNSK